MLCQRQQLTPEAARPRPSRAPLSTEIHPAYRLQHQPLTAPARHSTARRSEADRTAKTVAVVFPRGFGRVVPNRIVRWRQVRPGRRRFVDANRVWCESTRPAPHRFAFFLPNVVHSVAETRPIPRSMTSYRIGFRPSFGKLGRFGISTTSTFRRRPPKIIGLTSPFSRKPATNLTQHRNLG